MRVIKKLDEKTKEIIREQEILSQWRNIADRTAHDIRNVYESGGLNLADTPQYMQVSEILAACLKFLQDNPREV